MIQWEIVPALAELFEMSKSQVRRDLAAGGFYLSGPTGWERLPSGPDDVLEADGVPAFALIRHGKRDVRLAEFPK